MSEFEKERRRRVKVHNCFSGALALSNLSCRLDRAKRALAAGQALDSMDLWDLSRIAGEVRDAFGGKSRDAQQVVRDLSVLKEHQEQGRLTPGAAKEGIEKASAALLAVANSASDQCGRALATPPIRVPRKQQEPASPPPEISGRRGRKKK